MSIVSLSDDVKSNLNTEDIQVLAGRLNATMIEEKDAQDYLTVLRSFEAIMGTMETAPDYVPTELRSQASTNPRTCWQPQTQDNPCNAWSHRCHIQSQSPTTDLLVGRTVAIKDNISVAGLPTTLGVPATLFSNASYPVSDIDSSVVSRILNAGAIIKGTSTCESFCASPLSFTSASGLVHNPHLRNYTSGGSSSGSAVLVASHALKSERSGAWGETVELAVGSDQAGSVRIPASYCGIYGLKPTFGLVPYTGAISMTPMIDHLGPMGNTLEDIAALLEAMAGYDGFDPRMSPETPLRSQTTPYLSILSTLRHEISSSPTPGKDFRVGLLEESFSLAGVSDQVRITVTRTARDYFKAVGATVVGVSVPMHLQGPTIWTAATRPSMSSHLFQGLPLGHLSYLPGHARMRWPPSQSTLDTLKANNPAVVNILLSELFARNIASLGLEAKAHRKAFELRAAYDAAFANVDVLITPCAPTVAMPHPELDTSILERLKVGVGVTSNTCPFNITGHPAINVPCGFGSDARQPDVPLPIGMQIVGRRWADDQVIRAAALFEHGKQIFGKNYGAGDVAIS